MARKRLAELLDEETANRRKRRTDLTVPGKLREVISLATDGLARMEDAANGVLAARVAMETFERLAMEISSAGPALEDLQRAVLQDRLLKGDQT